MVKKGGLRCAVISDGYNFDAETDGSELFPSIKFKYRPCTHLDRMRWVDAEKEAGESSVKRAMAQAEIISKHVVSWNARLMTEDGKFKDAELTEENIINLDQKNFQDIILICLGWIKPTPEERKKEKEEDDKKAKELAKERLPELEENEKN